jgi:transposase-like protein
MMAHTRNMPMRKLKDGDKERIRDLYRQAGVTMRALADRFGVCPATICNVVHNKRRSERS